MRLLVDRSLLRYTIAIMLEDRSLPRIFCTYVASAIDALLLATAFIHFNAEYVIGNGRSGPASIPALFEDIFFLDFYVFFFLFSVLLFVLLWSTRRKFVMLATIVTIISANMSLYTLKELFPLKALIFFTWTITVSIRLELKYSIPVLLAGILSFVTLLFQPSMLGIVDSAISPAAAQSVDLGELFQVLTYLVLAAAFFCMYRRIIFKWQESEATKRHLGMAMTQVTAINHELQDYAKNKGREAAEEERLRITRDMHDSCGYVFVNIISLMQACISSPPVDWGRTTEIFATIQNLASQGLQETRQTLRAIRDIQDPVENNLDSLYQIKGIFQKVTGMEVILDRGNIKDDYGRSINKILIRIMQEGLTNSVKHGHASLVCVYFRDDGKFLYMTVKDNGIGSKQVVKGIGFSGMEERLKSVGGELKAGVSAEGGFQLDVKIPLMQILMEGHEHEQA